MNKELRIVYMGTPQFAVEPLRAIVQAGYNVLAVITAPDKPAGRGQKIQYSAVKEFALKNNIRILQPDKLKDPIFITEIKLFFKVNGRIFSFSFKIFESNSTSPYLSTSRDSAISIA